MQVTFYLVLAFLKDTAQGNGSLTPAWDTRGQLNDASLPAFIGQANANNGCKTGIMISLGGSQGIWKTKATSGEATCCKKKFKAGN